MTETKAELIVRYAGMRAGLLAAIEGLSDGQLGEPTLDGWAVKDHLIHIALWDEIRAAEVERISAGFDSVWKLDPEQERIVSELFYRLRREAPAAQARWELQGTHSHFMAALDRATERGLDASLYGEAGLLSRHELAHTGWILRWRGERGF